MSPRAPLDYPFRCDDDPQAISPAYADLPAVAQVTLRPSGMPAWIVTRYEDVQFVRRSPVFSREKADDLKIDGYPPLHGFMIGSDGAEHDRLRGVVKRAFTSARVESLRPFIENETATLLDAMVAKGEPGDLVQDLTLPLTMNTVGDLLGVPAADRAQFRQWGDAFLTTSALSQDESVQAQQYMGGYLASLVAERRAAPADDLLSEMIAQDDGARLTEWELINLSMEIMLAGWETSSAAISSFVYWLLTHDTDEGISHYRYLGAHLDEIPVASRELFRMVPVGAEDGLPRCATSDIEVGGVMIKAGDIVLTSHDAAHYDPNHFADPARVDLRRDPNPHMAFGYGKHYCLGAALARLEVQVVLAELTKRLPDLSVAVAPEDVKWKSGVSIRGLVELPVRWSG
jgi:cytochrome P450